MRYKKAHTNSRKRYIDCLNGQAYISDREIWSRAPKAVARKATAEGVNGIAIDEENGAFRIFQVSGYTRERGLFCDLLDEKGRCIK